MHNSRIKRTGGDISRSLKVERSQERQVFMSLPKMFSTGHCLFGLVIDYLQECGCLVLFYL